MKITVEYPDITYLHQEQETDLYWLLPDDLLPIEYRKERPNREQGWPQTVELIVSPGKGETIKLTEDRQRWLYKINPGLSPFSFAACFDTWNRKGMKFSDGNANFITGENKLAGLPLYPIDLTHACNVVKAKQIIEWGGGSGVPMGTKMLELVTVNADNLPWDCQYEGNEWLIHHLNTIVPVIYEDPITHKKRQKVNPFVHNGGGRNGGNACFTGLLCPEGTSLYIEYDRTVPVPIRPNPYWSIWKEELYGYY
jgi:hypothetical protein